MSIELSTIKNFNAYFLAESGRTLQITNLEVPKKPKNEKNMTKPVSLVSYNFQIKARLAELFAIFRKTYLYLCLFVSMIKLWLPRPLISGSSDVFLTLKLPSKLLKGQIHVIRSLRTSNDSNVKIKNNQCEILLR